MRIDLETFIEICDEFWEETNAKLGFRCTPKHPKEPGLFSMSVDFDEDIRLTKEFVYFLNERLCSRGDNDGETER